MTPHEEIETQHAWNVVETMRQMELLREQVVACIGHTMQTLAQPKQYQGMFGVQYVEDEVEHPLGHTLAVIDGILKGCYVQYGKDQYQAAQQMNIDFGDSCGNSTDA